MKLVQAGNSRTDVGVFAPPSQLFMSLEKLGVLAVAHDQNYFNPIRFLNYLFCSPGLLKYKNTLGHFALSSPSEP